MAKLEWDRRIERAKQEGRFTDEDKHAARSWDFCYLWELADHHNINSDYLATFRSADIAGHWFAESVKRNDFTWADKAVKQMRETVKDILLDRRARRSV
jgi:hypothetical protein